MKISISNLKQGAGYAHLFYTGFTWDEIEQITKALKDSYKKSRSARADEDAFFDYPSYAGLPKKIANKLTTDQVDLLNEEQPTTVKEVAFHLARGKAYPS